MSTFPVTKTFIKVLEDTAARNGSKRIRRIWLKAGKDVHFKGNTSAYLEDILKGTAARAAEIYIRNGSTAGKCRCCGLVFDNERSSSCPECGGAWDSISLDKKFIIDMVELEML